MNDVAKGNDTKLYVAKKSTTINLSLFLLSLRISSNSAWVDTEWTILRLLTNWNEREKKNLVFWNVTRLEWISTIKKKMPRQWWRVGWEKNSHRFFSSSRCFSLSSRVIATVSQSIPRFSLISNEKKKLLSTTEKRKEMFTKLKTICIQLLCFMAVGERKKWWIIGSKRKKERKKKLFFLLLLLSPNDDVFLCDVFFRCHNHWRANR